jgi:signal transduction histidine kinase
MSEDEFRADLRWPIDPLGERPSIVDPEEDAPGWRPPADLDDVAPPPGDRTVAEELDRISDRVLERLRAARVALDADLAELRTELGAIRQAMSQLERTPPPPAVVGPSTLAPLVEEVGALRAAVEALAAAVTPERLDDMAEELAGVQAELVSLRRRITLRAGGEGVALTDDQLDRLAAAVAAQIRRDGRRSGP